MGKRVYFFLLKLKLICFFSLFWYEYMDYDLGVIDLIFILDFKGREFFLKVMYYVRFGFVGSCGNGGCCGK